MLLFVGVRRVTMDVTVKKDLTFVPWPTPVRMGALAVWKVARPNVVAHRVSTHIFVLICCLFNSDCVHVFIPLNHFH